MTIQAVLSDVVKHCALANVEVLKVTGTATSTKVQTSDADKTLFIECDLLEAIPEFEGEFGITNLKMLSGLLGFTNYLTDSAEFKVRSRDVKAAKEKIVPVTIHGIGGEQKPGTETVPAVEARTAIDQFEFKGAGSKSVFKLMDIQHVPQQAKIANIPWGITLDEITKSKMTEFQQFAGLYAEIDKQFTVSQDDSNLVLSFGQQASSTHSGSMMLAENIAGTLSGGLTFPVDKFLTLMKIAVGASSSKLMFTSKGLLGVEVVTNHGNYKYYLRQSVRG